MRLEMGPVLRLQHRSDDIWHVSAIVVTAGETPTLTYRVYRRERAETEEGGLPNTADPTTLLPAGQATRGRCLLRYELPIQLEAGSEQVVEYGIDGADAGPWRFVVPRRRADTLRTAVTSCNGFSSNGERRHMAHPYSRWADLREQHRDAPLHLLIMAGDQVYADAIWDDARAVAQWAEREDEDKWRLSYNQAMAKDAAKFYFDLYVRSWGPPPANAAQRSSAMREMLASIPTVMMWDDHDIFDGWGSHPRRQTESPVYQGLFRTARKHFQAFQRHVAPGDADGQDAEATASDISPVTPNLSYGMTLGDIGILALDLRSERTRERILSDAAWQDLDHWLGNLGTGELRHLLVVSSVPVVHVDLSSLEHVTQVYNVADLDDDLRDHWLSRPHKQQRLELIQRLFAFGERTGARVTLLSGDIHVGALGLLDKQADADNAKRASSIYQVISSPIVHTTPPAVMASFYDWRADETEEIDRSTTSRFVPIPGSGEYYIGSRHWVRMSCQSEGNSRRLRFEWRPEDEDGDTAPPYRHSIDCPLERA